MANSRSKWAAVAVMLILGVSSVEAGDLATVQARGKLIVLTHPTIDSPFVAANLDAMREQGLKLEELRQPEHFSGAEIDLLRGFAKTLGVELEIHALAAGYDALFPALVAGDGDIVASEITITPKRRALADFSRPYVTDWLVVVTRRASTGPPIHNVAALQGRKGAVIGGSSHQELLEKVAPKARLELTSFDLESLEAVEQGRADFTLIETAAPVGGPPDAIHPGLRVAFRLRALEDAMALRKGSDLLPLLDRYLAGLAKSGELKRILDRNGVQAVKNPAPAPAKH